MGTEIFNILLTFVFALQATLPFILGRYISRALTVSSTNKYTYWHTVLLKSFIPTQLLAILISALYLTGSGAGAVIVGVLIHIVVAAGVIWFAYYSWAQCKKLDQAVLEFHDYLVNYKSTPRSKILRRHLPEMDAIVEEASCYEQSRSSIITPLLPHNVSRELDHSVKTVMVSQIFKYDNSINDGHEGSESISDDPERYIEHD